MRAIYKSFAGIQIPIYNRVESAGGGSARSGQIAIIGGFSDQGGLKTIRNIESIQISAVIFNQGDEGRTRRIAQIWRSVVGRRSRLVRHLKGRGNQYAIARLLSFEAQNADNGYPDLLSINLTLEKIGDWIGFEAENWRLNAGYRLNEGHKLNQTRTYQLAAGSGTIVINYGGDVDDRELTLAISAGAVPVPPGTRITMTGGCALQYLGTIAAGTTLTIDSGLKTIRSGSIDGYNALGFLPEHRVSSWLRLTPGRNVIGITAAAPVTVTIKYKERFA